MGSVERHDNSRLLHSTVQPDIAIDAENHISSSGFDDTVAQDVSDTASENAVSIGTEPIEHYRRPTPHTLDDTNMDPVLPDLLQTTSNDPSSHASSLGPDPIPNSASSSGQGRQITESQETELLCHYRYVVGPWIDVGDPESSFALGVLLAAREDTTLYDAIIAIAASHKALLNSVGERNLGRDHGARNQKSVFESRRPSEKSTNVVSSALGMLQEIVFSELQVWKSIMIRRLISQAPRPFLNSNGEVNSMLFWLYCRIGKHRIP